MTIYFPKKCCEKYKDGESIQHFEHKDKMLMLHLKWIVNQ